MEYSYASVLRTCWLSGGQQPPCTVRNSLCCRSFSGTGRNRPIPSECLSGNDWLSVFCLRPPKPIRTGCCTARRQVSCSTMPKVRRSSPRFISRISTPAMVIRIPPGILIYATFSQSTICVSLTWFTWGIGQQFFLRLINLSAKTPINCCLTSITILRQLRTVLQTILQTNNINLLVLREKLRTKSVLLSKQKNSVSCVNTGWSKIPKPRVALLITLKTDIFLFLLFKQRLIT